MIFGDHEYLQDAVKRALEIWRESDAENAMIFLQIVTGPAGKVTQKDIDWANAILGVK